MKANVPKAAAVPELESEGSYATEREVQDAISNLTEADHAKLFLIAKAFCKSRNFSTGVMEPEDLISEAIYRTLKLKKKWNKRITIVKHLDRAMENISGHLAGERSRIVPFPGPGAEDDVSEEERSEPEARVVNEVEERENCEILLKSQPSHSGTKKWLD